MGNEHLAGERSPGETSQELLGTGSGIPIRENEQRAAPRHEEPRKPEQERRNEDQAPTGVAELDIHDGHTIREEHSKEAPRPAPSSTEQGDRMTRR